MLLTMSELNRYKKELEKRRIEAKAYLIARMQTEAKGLAIADARKATIEIMQDTLGIYGDQAQALACDFFEEICEAEGIKAKAEIFDGVINEKSLEEKVIYHAGRLKNGDWDGYKSSNGDLISYYVRRSAYENIIKNCDRHKIRYARVPSGHETCAFCFMLASRGFVYHSEATAEGSHGIHHHCDCIIVPGDSSKTRIEGYDPDGMAERWGQCAKTVDIDPVHDKGDIARKKILKEVEKRDWEWLYTGKIPQFSCEEGAKPNMVEKNVDKILRENGFKTKFRSTRPQENKKTSDLMMSGSSYEIKTPQGSGRQVVYHQFSRAAGQSDRLVLDLSKLPMGTGSIWDSKKVIAESKKLLRYHYEYKKDGKSTVMQFKEALIVSKNGDITRVQRQ